MNNRPASRPGQFGAYGGAYIPETLAPAIAALVEAYTAAQADAAFWDELNALHRSFTGRPTAMTYAARLSAELGGAQIYLKREDLAHTGAHKINNALGQGLLARLVGKTLIIAETGAGLHADLDRHLGIDQAFGLEDLGARLAFDAFHDDEVAAMVDTGVIDLDDVRMDQFGDGQGFTPETGDEAVVIREVFGQHLDRNGPLQDAVGRPVHV